MAEPTHKFKVVHDEILSVGGEYPPLLSDREMDVHATCTEIRKFEAFGRQNYRFTFVVFSPAEFEGVELHCYAPYRPRKWKRTLPQSCKLLELAVVATGEKKHRHITRSMFLNKAFVCRVRPGGKGDSRYSVVDRLIKKLAG